MNRDTELFKKKLEANHDFPCSYMFKFIVPIRKKEALLNLLPKVDTKIKRSTSNKFISITLNMEIESSDKVIDIYNQVYQVEGLIAM
tara:strand:- start:696 stop:956 length:261 start_codon:yes stop_codon:yes gene_type:complete